MQINAKWVMVGLNTAVEQGKTCKNGHPTKNVMNSPQHMITPTEMNKARRLAAEKWPDWAECDGNFLELQLNVKES